MSDRVLISLLGAATFFVAALIGIIALFLLRESLGVLSDVGLVRFFTDSAWLPTLGRYNILPMVVASVLLMAGAVMIAAPVAVLIAVFLRFYAHLTLAAVGHRILEVLAGLPSVVYGLWGLVVVVPIIAAWQQPGASLITGILVLAVMVFPTAAIVIDSALKSLPPEILEVSEALALSRAYRIRAVVLPSIRASIATGIILAAARAVGETMAVMMVTGNIVAIPGDMFEPVRALTANIALEMGYALGNHRGALYVSSLLLMIVVVLLVAINALFTSNRRFA